MCRKFCIFVENILHMIRNPLIKSIPDEIVQELVKLYNKGVPNYLKNRGGGRQVEKFISNHMRNKKFSGFELNEGIGKDCERFEIKSLQVGSTMRPNNAVCISGTVCDTGIKYKDSNFKNKASLILFVCINSDGRIVDIRLSNYTQAELGLAYYKHNDMLCGDGKGKFCLNKKYFLTHTISVKKMSSPISTDFFFWMKQTKLKSETHSFTDWLKAI